MPGLRFPCQLPLSVCGRGKNPGIQLPIPSSEGAREGRKEGGRRRGRDAEDHAEEDKQRKEAVEVRNKADNSLYQAEKALNETYGSQGPGRLFFPLPPPKYRRNDDQLAWEGCRPSPDV